MKLSAFILNEISDKKRCPKCNTLLENRQESYLVDVRGDSLMIGCDGGLFCPNCPTVVLNDRVFRKAISPMAMGRSPRYTVLGMVDLGAVPRSKRDVPLGERNNPIPLIEFGYAPTEPEKPKKPKEPKKDKPQKKSRSWIVRVVGSQKPKKVEVGRNDPCPCGSGKKYKKCCMGKRSAGKRRGWFGRS